MSGGGRGRDQFCGEGGYVVFPIRGRVGEDGSAGEAEEGEAEEGSARLAALRCGEGVYG